MSQRQNWSRHVDDIIRSRHYTWIAEGLGGMPPEEALAEMLTDIIHICHRTEISFDDLLSDCQRRCEQEEAGVEPAAIV